MASLNASEFQFAFIFFAKFNEWRHYDFHRVIVPNQYQEGNPNYPYNGADIVLDEYFLQVKMPELLIAHNANHADEIGVPHFRFRIYNIPNHLNGNGQLDFLKHHSENAANKVFYVAPCFNINNYGHLPNNLNFWCNRFYQANPNNIWDFVTFIDISSIDAAWIEPNNQHSICYTANGDSYYFSEKKKIKTIKPTFESKAEMIKRASGTKKTIEEAIQNKIQEIKQTSGNRFFEINRIDENQLKLFDLQQIYLKAFNTFWIPILISKQEILKMKLDNLNNLDT